MTSCRQRLPIAAAAVILAAGLGACSSSSATSPSPKPAVSVSAIPGLSQADRKQDPQAYGALVNRLVQVFIRDEAHPADVRAMGRQIAAMPEVEAFHYVSKDEALELFGARLGKIVNFILQSHNPLPASYQILVRDPRDTLAVAKRFYDNPVVDNTPGTTDGVKVSWAALLVYSPSPSPSP